MFKKLLIYVLILVFLLPNSFGSFAYAARRPRPPETTTTTKTAPPTTTTASTTTSSVVTTTTTAKPDPNLARISGKVLKEDGTPLKNATVFLVDGPLFDPPTNVPANTIVEPMPVNLYFADVGSDGFNFQDLPPASYTPYIADNSQFYDVAEQSLFINAKKGNNQYNIKLTTADPAAAMAAPNRAGSAMPKAIYWENFQKKVEDYLRTSDPNQPNRNGEVLTGAQLEHDKYFYIKKKTDRLSYLRSHYHANHWLKYIIQFENKNNYEVYQGLSDWKKSATIWQRGGERINRIQNSRIMQGAGRVINSLSLNPGDASLLNSAVTVMAAATGPVAPALESALQSVGGKATAVLTKPVKNLLNKLVVEIAPGVKIPVSSEFITAVGEKVGSTRSENLLLVKLSAGAQKLVLDKYGKIIGGGLTNADWWKNPGALAFDNLENGVSATIRGDNIIYNIRYFRAAEEVGMGKTSKTMVHEFIHLLSGNAGFYPVYGHGNIGYNPMVEGITEFLTRKVTGISSASLSYNYETGIVEKGLIKAIMKKTGGSQSEAENILAEYYFKKGLPELDILLHGPNPGQKRLIAQLNELIIQNLSYYRRFVGSGDPQMIETYKKVSIETRNEINRLFVDYGFEPPVLPQ